MANKGEWSEVYTFFKLLADGRLYSADGHLQLRRDKFTQILKVFRDDSPNRIAYEVHAAKKMILCAGKELSFEVPQETFTREAKRLLALINSPGICDVDFADVRSFMERIKIEKVKAKSKDKADIRIVIHRIDGTTPEQGYSIKSKLGACSTLINSNKDASNFIFRIDGINDEQMRHVNSLGKFKQKFEYLRSVGAKWEFLKVAQDILRSNLDMLDMSMATIVAACLEKYYTGQASGVSDICRELTKNDPLHIVRGGSQPMYEYKVKQFLLAFALGMTVTTPWNGKYNANGGYIVVREDGEIACYHFFDRNELEEYLFYNTAFDTPSTTRHGYGEVYKDGENYCLRLNLQVRFKK